MATGAWKAVESDGDWTFPKQHAFDHSYLRNWWEKCDVWLTDESVLARHVNFNGYVERNGSSMIHAHPNNGTKAWVWGQAPNERYWQDFGGGPAVYNYNTELQTGVMPTQYQGFPMAAGEVFEWSELIMPIPELGAERMGKLYSDDYHGVAIEEVERLMAARGIGQRNSSHYDAINAWLTRVGKIAPPSACRTASLPLCVAPPVPTRSIHAPFSWASSAPWAAVACPASRRPAPRRRFRSWSRREQP